MLQLVGAAHQSVRQLLNAVGLRSAGAHNPGIERGAAQFRITREQGAWKLALLDHFSDDLLDSIRADHNEFSAILMGSLVCSARSLNACEALC